MSNLIAHSLTAPTSFHVPDLVPGSKSPAEAPFGNFLNSALHNIDQLRAEAQDKVQGLMQGDGTDIHTAMIATQKADLAFDLALSLRNKAVGAYQQLMSMQF